jgi:hypothetical protein
LVQPISEGIVQQTQIFQKELAAETRATVQKAAGYVSPPLPSGSQNTETTHKIVELNPIICETEKKRIIEEIQPGKFAAVSLSHSCQLYTKTSCSLS